MIKKIASSSLLVFMIFSGITLEAKDPGSLSESEVKNLKAGTRGYKERLMWEYPHLEDPNELFSGAMDIVDMYPNDKEWQDLFGKLLKDKLRKRYAIYALGRYGARQYEEEIYNACIDDGKILWEALESLLDMNSPYLEKAVRKSRPYAKKGFELKLLQEFEKGISK